MPQTPGPVQLNRFTRVPRWLKEALTLKDELVPEGLFLPGVVPTVDITAVAARVVFATTALIVGTITQLPDIPGVAIGLQAPSGNGLNIVLIGGPGAAGSWEIATGSSTFLSLNNPNNLFATMNVGAGNISIVVLQSV